MFDFGQSESSSIYMNSSHHPYTSSIASSASSSSSSVFSADSVSSQASVSSASTGSIHFVWGTEDRRSYSPLADDTSQYAPSLCTVEAASDVFGSAASATSNTDAAVVPDLRQHPRRTKPLAQQDQKHGILPTVCPRPPPTLVRQCDRKVNFVDNLVDSASQIVETIWPLSVIASRSDSSPGSKGVLPLRTFIQETLRRSRTSYSTLQVALYYLILIKPSIPKHNFTMEQPEDGQSLRTMQCGRRMFLAALILASKYLQDRNYSARAWSKISGLNTLEINMNEMTFLTAVNWRLHISETVFQRWTDIVLRYTPSPHPPPSPTSVPSPMEKRNDWRFIIPKLTAELNDVDVGIMTPPAPVSKFSSSNCPFALHRSTGEPVNPIAVFKGTGQTNLPPHAMPRVLEPAPRQFNSVDRQTPSFVQLGPLPTPEMTPRSNAFNTPAASIAAYSSRRPSMSVAMAQVHNACMARTTIDQWDPQPQYKAFGNHEAHPALARRLSLGRSSSSASSPESMVSDVSSRSSRSSSISSVSSSICALSKPRLAIQATRRCATLQMSGRKENSKNFGVTQSTEDLSSLELSSSPDSYFSPSCAVPDFADFSLRTPHEVPAKSGCGDLYQVAAHGLCELATSNERGYSNPIPPVNRKRCRESVDLSLQHHVRQLVCTRDRNEEDSSILPDGRLADSFLVPEVSVKTVQPPLSARLCTQRLPLERDMGRKRACCGEAAERTVNDRTPGPGMWDGIL